MVATAKQALLILSLSLKKKKKKTPKGLILSLKMKMKSTKRSGTGMIVLVFMSYGRTPTTQALLVLHCAGRRTPPRCFSLWTFPGTKTLFRSYRHLKVVEANVCLEF